MSREHRAQQGHQSADAAGIKNPVRPDGTVEPLLDYQAAFMNKDGSIVGFARIDVIDGPGGATVKVRE